VKLTGLFSFAIALPALATETTDFSRYQTIVERAPFGAVQGVAQDTKPNWLERYQYVGNIVSNAGNGPVQAILFDKEASRSYFRAEGEMLDPDVSVVSIDINQRPPKIVLKKGLETGTLTFPERSTVASAPMPSQAAPPVPGMPGAAAAQPPTIRRIPFRRGN
jgi:hypothetical protein